MRSTISAGAAAPSTVPGPGKRAAPSRKPASGPARRRSPTTYVLPPTTSYLAANLFERRREIGGEVLDILKADGQAKPVAPKNKIDPAPECKGDAYLSEYQLPRSLSEALGWLADEKDLHDVLGKSFITVYSEVKEIEHDEFMKVISPWEREHLLLHV